jgi:hypothetical protein
MCATPDESSLENYELLSHDGDTDCTFPFVSAAELSASIRNGAFINYSFSFLILRKVFQFFALRRGKKFNAQDCAHILGLKPN